MDYKSTWSMDKAEKAWDSLTAAICLKIWKERNNTVFLEKTSSVYFVLQKSLHSYRSMFGKSKDRGMTRNGEAQNPWSLNLFILGGPWNYSWEPGHDTQSGIEKYPKQAPLDILQTPPCIFPGFETIDNGVENSVGVYCKYYSVHFSNSQ